VVYPFTRNNLTPRTHSTYLNAAKEAQTKSIRGKAVSIGGIKGLSTLLQIFEYPCQIVFDYMHLVCLGHVPSLIKRWCQNVDKSVVNSIDASLNQLRLPHNLNIPFLESVSNAGQWKAKNNRLFVLNVGVPIVTLHLPRLLASHFLLYSMAVKIFHAPESIEEINLAEQVMNYYCKTAPLIHNSSIEIFSLHAHIHLAQQVRRHGGLAHTSAFAFESCIRFIQKKAHGSKHLGAQISYWIDLQTMIQTQQVKAPTIAAINEIKWLDGRLSSYQAALSGQLASYKFDVYSCSFYLRFKHFFVTYHTIIYDQSFKCQSYIVSFSDSTHDFIQYGNSIVFVKSNSHFFVLVQKYKLSKKSITDYVDIPASLHSKINQLFPLLQLSDEFLLIPIEMIRHKCVSIAFDVMYTTNTYAKPYLNRRTNTEAEMYNLVLFPSDNSIAVVKVKQCSPAEHDGFIFVQSGKKKFMGVILEEGQNSNNQQPITSTITISTERTNCANSSQSLNTNPSMINNDNVLIGLQPTTSSVETCLSRSQIAHKSNENDHKNMSNLKHKRHKKSHNVTSSAVLFDQFNNMNNESSDSEDELINNSEHRIDTNELSSNGAPKFVGCHITGENNRSKSASGQLSSSTTQQLSTFMNKLESQYLRPLLVGQERIEERIKCLFANQKKIQNVLRKQK
ncbi:unnamed protein product, partial [Rotaria socialis]